MTTVFGVDIYKDVGRRVLEQYYQPSGGGNGPLWTTFIGHVKDCLWSVDLFRCESILLKSHWVMVVMDGISTLDGSLDLAYRQAPLMVPHCVECLTRQG